MFRSGALHVRSNFPVDRFSLSYRTVWNAFKKLAAAFSDQDQHQLFYGTARRVYGLEQR